MGRGRVFVNQWGAGFSPVPCSYWIVAMSHKSYGVEPHWKKSASILVKQAARLHTNSVFLSRGYTGQLKGSLM